MDLKDYKDEFDDEEDIEDYWHDIDIDFVEDELKEICDKYHGYYYSDVSFLDIDKKLFFIDHTLITRGGIFVIRRKSNKGTVMGGIDEPIWLVGGRTIPNALMENEERINKFLSLFINKKPKLINMVLVMRAYFLYQADAKFVCNLPFAVDEFIKVANEELYTLEELAEFNKVIKENIIENK